METTTVRIRVLDLPEMRAIVTAAIDLLHAVEGAPEECLSIDIVEKRAALREVVDEYVSPGEPTRDPLSDEQREQLVARCMEFDRRLQLARGSGRREALAAASMRFGRTIESITDLSALEAREMLAWLSEELA